MYDDEYYDRREPRNPMATVSVILGILALLSCSIFYIALPCGALAIICAILSRRHIMPKRGMIGVICGTLGIILSVCITIYAVYYVLSSESGRSWLQYYLQMYTGDSDLSLDDFLNGLYGTGDSTEDGERSLLPDGSSGEDDGSLPDTKDGGDTTPGDNSGNGDSLPGSNGGSDSLPGGNGNGNDNNNAGFGSDDFV